MNDALVTQGFEVWPRLLTHAQCDEVTALYDDASRFRSKVVMARHNFGRGEYQYFGDPLPELISSLRRDLYERLVPIAEQWTKTQWPMTHAEFLKDCHDAGQTRPTPLLLRYGEGDFNCLHQDLYGERVFPLQVAILLSEPARDFTGGEFVLTEQRPRMQSRVHVVPLSKGDAVAFAVNHVPRRGVRGTWKASLRHGVSVVRSGARHTLGIIFHDGP
ncbi:MAG: 2OG-Fe(II) oxygenase [Archangium sp.]